MSDSNHPNPLATTDSSNGYWPAGQIRQILLGNGVTETTAYNNRLQPCRMNVNSTSPGTAYSSCTDSVPSNNIEDFGYGYNAGVSDNGNVAYWSGTGAQSFSRNYAYDNVNRLLNYSASSDDPTGCTGLSWNDDQWGNRTDQTVTSGTCPTFHQTVDGNNRLNTSSYRYDAAGNMTYDGSHHYYYDAENRLIQVDGTFDGTLSSCSAAGACYLYDYAGHRVQRIVGGGTPANYLYDLDGHVNSEIDLANGSFDNSNHKLGWWASYIYLGGKLLAEYTNGTTYFAHKDHLGSTRLLTDMTSPTPAVVESLDYFPYGELYSYSSSGDTQLKFTGKERDSESGLDNFGARYMSSQYGRFMSPDEFKGGIVDPFTGKDIETNAVLPYADITDPQTLNKYAYVRNNPLRYVDPDGHGECDMDANNCPEQAQNVHCENANCTKISQTIVVTAGGGFWSKVKSWLSGAASGAFGGLLTRYMGKEEAQTAAKTGNIPNTDPQGNPRPTHFTKDDPINDPQAAQSKYELQNTPTHRATVPDDRAPNARVPDDGPMTSGGGSQVVTDDPVPVMPDEIVPLDPIIIDPLL